MNNKQIKLGEDPVGEKPSPDVMREYHRLMASFGLLSVADRRASTVPEVCEAFLEARESRRDRTKSAYQQSLSRLALRHIRTPFSKLASADLIKVAEGEKGWGESSKALFIKHAVTVFRWAREAGYTEYNALAGFENPYVIKTRERGLTEKEFQVIVGKANSVEFTRIMCFLRGTGCRSAEACVVTAAHVHRDLPLVSLAPEEHKTGRRTKKIRVLIMPADVNKMVRELIVIRPTGTLFLTDGGPGSWTPDALGWRFRSYRRKLGLPNDVTVHLMRHAAATRWVETGADLSLVAKMMGHATTSTLQSTYYHPDVMKMVAVADQDPKSSAS